MKKYLKITKFIHKTKKIIKCQNIPQKLRNVTSEKLGLIKKFKSCNRKIQQNNELYESDIKHLQEKINRLENSLKVSQNRYELARKQINVHIHVASELVDL